jgi:UDP-N-acetylglucosamine--N-acetylmuramyl-(pentapeptide) pyrophosphoryl-undecaprenol N-acetylglucosamine transferase
VRVVIAGGGSGGHLFPGVAVAQELLEREPGAEVVFIGSETGIEARVIPREGYPIRYVRSAAVLGRSPVRKAVALFVVLASMRACSQVYRELRPDVVVGTGGYVSFAPVAAARLQSIPTLVMEQNLVPGLANRVLGKMADSVAVTYHESLAFFPKEKSRLTGNPVRSGVLRGKRGEALKLFSLEGGRVTFLVLGGSAGASRINDAVLNALHHLLDVRDGVQFLHQTGQQDYERVRKIYRDMGFKAMVAPFIHQMGEAYAASDAVICRAGATTLAEITALGRPSVLVPYPHAAGHQEFNARKLLENGGCRMLHERELTGKALAGHIAELYRSEDLRADMRSHCRALGRPDAAQKVVDMALSLVKARSGNV